MSKLNFSLALICACTFFSCSYKGDYIEPGKYQCMSYSVTEGNQSIMGKMKQMPLFEFRDDRIVKVYPDFYFGYFKDSIFKYEYYSNKNLLILKGDNVNLKIECIYEPTSARDSYRLNNLNEYISRFDITGERFD